MRRSRGWTHERLQAHYDERRHDVAEILSFAWRSDISILGRLALIGLPEPDDRIIIKYPRPKVKPPADRIPVRFRHGTFDSIYKVVERPEVFEAALAEARRLWPLFDEIKTKEIAEKVGIREVILYNILGARGTLTADRPPKYDTAEVLRLYNSGIGPNAIARELGISLGSIQWVLAKVGLRPPQGPRKQRKGSE